MKDIIIKDIKESARIKDSMLNDTKIIEDIEKMTNLCIRAFSQGHKILICGNGGSAGDAQHFSTELLSKFVLDRKAIPAIALTTNTSVMTAIGNDHDFNTIFSRQIEALGEKGDIFFGISTSGNSKNVIEAVKVAREKGLVAISLTGKSGGLLKDYSDICIRIDSDNTPRIQEAQVLVIHILCEIVEKELVDTGVI